MSWFEDLWFDNVMFFNQPALNAASPDSQLEKLQEELDELKADHSLEEAADVLVCLIGWAIKSGYEPWELLTALDKKTGKNLARTWELQANGTYQHTAEG